MAVRNFRVALADGTAGKAVSFFSGNPLASPGTGPLETCIGTKAPKTLMAGQAATECRVVMLAEDAKPATVSYSDESVPGRGRWRAANRRRCGRGQAGQGDVEGHE